MLKKISLFLLFFLKISACIYGGIMEDVVFIQQEATLDSNSFKYLWYCIIHNCDNPFLSIGSFPTNETIINHLFLKHDISVFNFDTNTFSVGTNEFPFHLSVRGLRTYTEYIQNDTFLNSAKALLSYHKKIKDLSDGNYNIEEKCTICGKLIQTLDGLKKHYQYMHHIETSSLKVSYICTLHKTDFFGERNARRHLEKWHYKN